MERSDGKETPQHHWHSHVSNVLILSFDGSAMQCPLLSLEFFPGLATLAFDP